MALSRTQIQTLIDTNLADFSNILPVKHREVETEILNFISTSTTSNIGYITIGDIDNGKTIGSAYTTNGNVSAILDSVSARGEWVKVTLQNSMPNLNYFVRTSLESLGALGSMEYDNDIHPIVFKIDSVNSFYLYVEDMGAVQNIRVHIETLAY